MVDPKYAAVLCSRNRGLHDEKHWGDEWYKPVSSPFLHSVPSIIVNR